MEFVVVFGPVVDLVAPSRQRLGARRQGRLYAGMVKFLERGSRSLAGVLIASLFTVWGAVQLFKDSPSPPAYVYFLTAAVFLLLGVASFIRQKRRQTPTAGPTVSS